MNFRKACFEVIDRVMNIMNTFCLKIIKNGRFIIYYINYI